MNRLKLENKTGKQQIVNNLNYSINIVNNGLHMFIKADYEKRSLV